MVLGEGSTAIAAAERLVLATPHDLQGRLAHVQLLAQNGRELQARAVAEALVGSAPHVSAIWHLLGSCRATLGELEASQADFRQAIALAGNSYAAAPSWLSIAEASNATSCEDVEAMERLVAQPASTPPEREARGAVQFALGKVYDDRGLIDQAFAAYSEGANAVNALRGAAIQATDGFVDGVVSDFTAQVLSELPPSDVTSIRPIFVLGLPRTGTTLVEQILVSHDSVHRGAELNLFKAASLPIGGFSMRDVVVFAKLHPEGLSRVGATYLELLEDRFGAEGRVVDKTLNHSRYLGLIHHVFPNARFIWLRRDPGAAAWSCFRTWFARGVGWSWSLENIAHHFRAEDKLHAHWTQVMGDAILTVPYESLVSDPVPWIARMVDHVGLTFQDGLQDFHQTKRAVTTASFAQVRRPVYSSSREAWKRYETHLQPFFDAYVR